MEGVIGGAPGGDVYQTYGFDDASLYDVNEDRL